MAWIQALGAVSNLIGAGASAYGAYQSGAGMDSDDLKWSILEQRNRDSQNEALQREFAQNSIRWRVRDAAAAGLHPLAALGVAPGGYAPSGGGAYAVGDTGDSGNLARSLGSFGQDVGRQFSQMQTPQEKAFKALQLEGMAVDNDIAKMDLASRRKALLESSSGVGDNAGYTIGGQPDALMGRIRVHPSLVTSSERGAAQQAAGASPMFDMYKTKRGFLGLLNQKASEATEDDYLAKLGIHIQSLMSGRGGPQVMTSNFKSRPGHRWAYGGPLMGYGSVPDSSMTLWEALHAGGSEFRDWMRPVRGRRFLEDDDRRFK